MSRMATRCFPGDRARLSRCDRQLCLPADCRTVQATILTAPIRLRVGFVLLSCWLWGSNALCQGIPPRPVTSGSTGSSAAPGLAVQQGASGLGVDLRGVDVLRPRTPESAIRVPPPVLDAVIGEGIKIGPDSSICAAAGCSDARDSQGSEAPNVRPDVDSVAVPGKS